MAKTVVYLFGAGATQAAVSVVDEARSVLMKDVTQDVFFTIRDQEIVELLPLNNILLDDHIDIEHLITHLLATYTPVHARMAARLRELFHASLLSRLGPLAGGASPNLFAALFDYHTSADQPEELKGVISLNYDELADLAFDDVFGGVNYIIDLEQHHPRIKLSSAVPPFIKLHGSFNWRNGTPIALVDESVVTSDDVLWIPPGITKPHDYYPFNLLWGTAHALLHCDVLRIVGCSLSPNDMHLVSLLFQTQALSSSSPYAIEIIDYPQSCAQISSNYGYLAISGVMDQEDFATSLASDLIAVEPGGLPLSPEQRQEISGLLDTRAINVFDRWFRARAEAAIVANPSFRTATGALQEYMGWEAK